MDFKIIHVFVRQWHLDIIDEDKIMNIRTSISHQRTPLTRMNQAYNFLKQKSIQLESILSQFPVFQRQAQEYSISHITVLILYLVSIMSVVLIHMKVASDHLTVIAGTM